jgi:hypothetical protein
MILINQMIIKEFIFNTKTEMVLKMEAEACKYEGYIPGRNGYNFPNNDGSYTIAYIKNDIITKKHEQLHAKFYFDSEYRKKVQKIWCSFSEKEQTVIQNFLSKCGYRPENFLDEFQAYLMSEPNPERLFGIKNIRKRINY